MRLSPLWSISIDILLRFSYIQSNEKRILIIPGGGLKSKATMVGEGLSDPLQKGTLRPLSVSFLKRLEERIGI